jgi:glycosyltransferase involved in cell wall biosynthesis
MKKRLLLSAYACEPNKGSEPSVGWNWTTELSKRFELYVITRRNNRLKIERGCKGNIDLENVRFFYYDLPSVILKAKPYIGIYIYYSLWQLGAYLYIKRKFGKSYFDIIQHLTFVSIRFPTFFHRMNCKFVFGPVAGGESANHYLLSSLDFKYRFFEVLRELTTSLSKYNFIVNKAIRQSDLVVAVTEETAVRIKHLANNRLLVSPAIGINGFDNLKPRNSHPKSNGGFKVIYAGRLLHWKGVHLAIEAFAKFNYEFPNSTFLIIGKGPFESKLKALANKTNARRNIEFNKWCPQTELLSQLRKADVFLFPSFHDSGGLVVLEAMSVGLPVICLDRGGPSAFYGQNENCINTNQPAELIVDDIRKRLLFMANNNQWCRNEAIRVLNRVKEHTWRNAVSKVYTALMYENINHS